MLQVAASVWGNHKQELMVWNGTEKGLLDRAKHYQDRPLFLDELGAGEFTPPALSKLLYSLAGGKGRVRSSSQGKAIGGEAFRTFAISSGEFPIQDFMTGAKQRPNRGTLLRGMDIEIADAAEELPEEQREPFMAKLNQATKTAFGTAAKAFLQGLVEQYPQADDLNQFVVAKVAGILRDFDLPLQDAAIKRGLERFALLAVAGELAVELELLPLGDAKQVHKAIRVYAAAWYQTHSPQSVQQRLIEHIVSFIYSSEKRFQRVAGPSPANRVGWDCLINGVPCYAFTSDGLKEASNESDVSMVAKLLQGAGLLVQNDPSKLKARLPKGNRLYCYAVNKDILSYSDEVA
jgi:putative DNA primase/helicase